MLSFTCHVTRRDGIARRVEVKAENHAAAISLALGGHPGGVSCRADDAPRFSRDLGPFRRSGDLQ